MPREIEEVLEGHPAISQAFAVGLSDERWGEIGANLARFKVPKRVVFYGADALPTTPTGKVQKFRLAEQLNQR